jgi:hypothetical protein
VTAKHNDEFSLEEREALALWRPVEPPAGFSERVLLQASRERGAASPLRGMAVAALAMVLLGGLFSVRALLGQGNAPADAPGGTRGFPAGLSTQDAGPRPEVLGLEDGKPS